MSVPVKISDFSCTQWGLYDLGSKILKGKYNLVVTLYLSTHILVRHKVEILFLFCTLKVLILVTGAVCSFSNAILMSYIT